MNDFYIKNGKVLIDKTFHELNLTILNGKIKDISKLSIPPQGIPVYDAKGNFVVPGFIDVHTHGAINIDVNSATAKDLEKISHFYALQGTTSWLCSIITDTKEQTLWCINQYHKYRKMESNGAVLMGIHLEGPFLASKYKGAMPEQMLRTFDLELLKEYQQAAKGKILYITISPEVEGVVENIHRMVDLGMVVAMGHSGADYNTAMRCINEGASAATHTFNAMKLMHQHQPAITGAVLETEVYCEAICDGRHLHPGVVRLLLKTKGMNKVIAVSDSTMATGLPDGKYKLGLNDIIVVDGDAMLADTITRAGSTLTTHNALKNLLQFTGKPLEEVIGLFTENPARMLGIIDQKGSLAISKDADLVILNENIDIINTFVNGKQIVSYE